MQNKENLISFQYITMSNAYWAVNSFTGIAGELAKNPESQWNVHDILWRQSHGEADGHTVSWKVENTCFRPKISYIDILLEEWN